jgi:HTH-type transcriptional regulator, competence development regulator
MFMALTPFGKALRKLRIDGDMLLKDMADGIKVTSAFLSAIEAGRKPIPHYLIGRIADWMRLGREDIEALRDAAALSAAKVEITLSGMSSIFDRTLANQLARNFEELDEGQKFEIKRIMERRKV